VLKLDHRVELRVMLGLSTLVNVSLLEHDHTYSVHRLLGLVFRHDFLQGKREPPTPQPRHMSNTSRDVHVKRVDASPKALVDHDSHVVGEGDAHRRASYLGAACIIPHDRSASRNRVLLL